MRSVVLLATLAAGTVMAQEPHAGHDMSSTEHTPISIPEVTPAERAAAFPDLNGMSMREHMNDDPTNVTILVDRFEQRDVTSGSPLVWDASLSIGRDFGKLLLRSEGERTHGRTEEGNIEALWARPVARWWELVAGARHDFRPEESRSWLAVGLAGLAPYRFEVEATAYLGEGGRTAFELQTEYELLLTNRLILQPRLELSIYGKEDAGRDLGSGVSSAEAGFRLRYEIRREVAPYVGVAWVNKYGGTADLARARGLDAHEVQTIVGLRVWY